MPRLDTLSNVVRQVLLGYPCIEPATTPWQPLQKTLADSRLGLVTSAGLHLRSDRPFVSDPKGGDTSYRVIPTDSDANDIIQSHTSIGFDHTAIYQDLNVTFPLDRLRELAQQGVIGDLSPTAYSFMGALRDARPILNETGPEVAQRLKDEGVTAVLLTPT